MARRRISLLRQLDAAAPREIRKLKGPNRQSAMHLAAPYADPEALAWLQSRGVAIDEPDARGLTPLIIAAGYSNAPAVCWLIDNGTRIDHRNASGHTALQYAIVKQQSEAAACLLSYKPDIDSPGPRGAIPIMQALLFRDREIAQSLLDLDAPWNLRSEYLDPSLESARQLDFAAALQLAIDQGLAPSRELYGRYPLPWLAAYLGANACSNMLDGPQILAKSEIGKVGMGLPLSAFDGDQAAALCETPLPRRIRVRRLVDPEGKAPAPSPRSTRPRCPKRRAEPRRLLRLRSRNRHPNPALAPRGVRHLVDRYERSFPRDLRFASLFEIADPRQPDRSDTDASQPFPL